MLVDEPAVLPWSRGSLLSTRLASTYMRVTPRGVLASTSPLDQTALDDTHWNREACAPVATALCAEVDSAMRWLSSKVVDVPDDWGQLPDTKFMRMVNQSGACRQSDTGREISVTDREYEVSLCDFQDLNLDVVYNSTSQELFWRQAEVSSYEILIIAIIAIYLISSVAQNIVHMFHIQISPSSQTEPTTNSKKEIILESGIVATVTGYIFVRLVFIDFHTIIASDDRVLLFHLLIYILIIGTHNLVCALRSTDNGIPGVNISVITASLILLTARVYYSFDNTFIFVLTLLFAWRTFVKLMTCNGEDDWTLGLTVFDSLTLCSVIENSLTKTSLYLIDMQLSVVFLLCLALIMSTVSCKYIPGH